MKQFIQAVGIAHTVRIYVAVAISGIAVIMLMGYLLAWPNQEPSSIGILEANGSPPLGDAAAPLTIIEWGDYQCTFCYRFHQTTMNTILEEYIKPGKVRIIFQDFPLNGPDSILAAQAARCAADQGQFWEYHNTIYENWAGERTGWIRPPVLYGFALNVGLDMRLYNECMMADTHIQDIRDAYHTFQDEGIDATPSFVIHDGNQTVRIVGNQPAEVFIRVIEDMLQ